MSRVYKNGWRALWALWAMMTLSPTLALALDTTPDAFNFTDQYEVPANTLTTSNTLTISGIDVGAAVTVSGFDSPQIRINGGAWTTSGTITNGQTLQVRLTTPMNSSQSVHFATVTVGGVSDTWNVYTADVQPDFFSFSNQTDVPLSDLITSNTVTVTGISIPASVEVLANETHACGDGSPQISINGGAWTTFGTITDGQTLQVRMTSACALSTYLEAQVHIGGWAGLYYLWGVTTTAYDTLPDVFSFTDQTGVALSTLATSNTRTISGISVPVNVLVSGPGSPQISINGGAWATSGTISNGQTLAVRLTSASAYSTTYTATVTVGGASDTWDVTTLAQDGTAAQVCQDRIAASAPDQRYTDHGDGTVTDKVTGLIWQQCAEGLSGADCLTGSAMTLTWQEALQHAAEAEFAGHSDWRLPNVKELYSLVEMRCKKPALNSRLFPNTPPDRFWSSTPVHEEIHTQHVDNGGALLVDFREGSWAAEHKEEPLGGYPQLYVRLVRDAD